MSPIVWWIVAVGFVAPAVARLGRFLLHRRSRGTPGRAMGALWAVLRVLLLAFAGLGLVSAN